VLVLASALASCLTLSTGHAQVDPSPTGVTSDTLSSPYSPLVRQHYYAQLTKSPWRALGFELLAPGAGNAYVGLYAPAVTTLGVSLLGAGLWVAGAVRNRPVLWWTGVGTLAAGRTFGIVSAPLGAALLNAAFRRQLGISLGY